MVDDMKAKYKMQYSVSNKKQCVYQYSTLYETSSIEQIDMRGRVHPLETYACGKVPPHAEETVCSIHDPV